HLLHGRHGEEPHQGDRLLRQGDDGRLEELPGRSRAGQRPDQAGQPEHDRRTAHLQRRQAQGDGHCHQRRCDQARHRHHERGAHQAELQLPGGEQAARPGQAQAGRRVQARLHQGREGDAL
ncbi:MAG: Hydroxymethylpyrimidine ABC transporter, substrate-binding component, partial [uncultured Ramlibacter sp.]